MNCQKTTVLALLATGLLWAGGVPDAMRAPELRDVRLKGHPAEKMNAFFDARIRSRHAQIRDDSTVNNKGYSVSLAPLPATDTWGLWDVTLSKSGAETIKARACDFQSAGDDPHGEGADAFSIWF